MAVHLSPKFSHPLEREYEGWIVAEIEEYLDALEIQYSLFAVSPNEEVTWPSDERLEFRGKVVGIQFKQAKLAKKKKNGSATDLDRLKWDFHQPTGQFAKVKMHDEIYYCLPTFVNREYRRVSLHHCLFWRPSCQHKTVWYDNCCDVDDCHCRARHALRWGHLVERLLGCKLGKPISSPQEARDYIARMRELLHEPAEGHIESPKALIFIFVEMN